VRCAVMLSLLAFAAACRSASSDASPAPPHAETPPPITATPPTASPPSATPPPTTGTTAPPALAGAPLPTGNECRSNADCMLTYVPESSCCATMCAPKGVTVAEGRRRDDMVHDCEQKRGHPCPVPACRARAFQAACEGGTCTAKMVDDH
jgi:hypothetical protein